MILIVVMALIFFYYSDLFVVWIVIIAATLACGWTVISITAVVTPAVPTTTRDSPQMKIFCAAASSSGALCRYRNKEVKHNIVVSECS